MAKRIKKRRTQERPAITLSPVDVAPVDPADFSFAVRVGAAAATYRMPMKSPASYGINLQLGDGSVGRINLTDIPMNRASLAFREHCGTDEKKFMSIMFRQFALFLLMSSENMKPWVAAEEGGRFVHPAVIEAAATMPIDGRGHFDETAFFEKVSVIASRMNEAEPPPDS